MVGIRSFPIFRFHVSFRECIYPNISFIPKPFWISRICPGANRYRGANRSENFQVLLHVSETSGSWWISALEPAKMGIPGWWFFPRKWTNGSTLKRDHFKRKGLFSNQPFFRGYVRFWGSTRWKTSIITQIWWCWRWVSFQRSDFQGLLLVFRGISNDDSFYCYWDPGSSQNGMRRCGSEILQRCFCCGNLISFHSAQIWCLRGFSSLSIIHL